MPDPLVTLQTGTDEDEAAAMATPGHGTATWQPYASRDDEQTVDGYMVTSAPEFAVLTAAGLGPLDGAGVVAHASRQDPSATMRRVEAYKAIMGASVTAGSLHSEWGQGGTAQPCGS